MSIPNQTVQDITADVTLATSKPKIKQNFDALLANEVHLDANKQDISPKVKFTPEGGLAIKLTNKTGSASIKGSIISASTTTENAFKLQTDEFDSIGSVYETGVADGQECWIVVSGIAEVLLVDNTASTRGNWAIASIVDGRADITMPTPIPNNTTGEHTQHFKEIGHSLESKAAGTNVLCKVVLHFN